METFCSMASQDAVSRTNNGSGEIDLWPITHRRRAESSRLKFSGKLANG
jgi:hypothetical protein